MKKLNLIAILCRFAQTERADENNHHMVAMSSRITSEITLSIDGEVKMI